MALGPPRPPLKYHCPPLMKSQGPGCPFKPTHTYVGCLEIRKTEIAMHIFKIRSRRLYSLITMEVGLSDTQKKPIDLGKVILLSFLFFQPISHCHDTCGFEWTARP